MFEIEYTDEWDAWYETLDQVDQERIADALDALAESGPDLKRPLVGIITGSKLKNLKELCVTASRGHRLRTLFLFDPRRTAILLIGGDKTGNWTGWYKEAIREAEELYEIYLEELRKEGELG